jgi:hypothetical protein
MLNLDSCPERATNGDSGAMSYDRSTQGIVPSVQALPMGGLGCLSVDSSELASELALFTALNIYDNLAIAMH